MTAENWFRRTSWSDEDRKAFFTRLQRCRGESNRCQYLAIQGNTLADKGYYSEAIELLTQVVLEFPGQKIHSASSYCSIAECYVGLQNSELAISNFRKALEEERAFPNVRTRTWLAYPWYIVATEQIKLYSEALTIIDEFEGKSSLDFPVDMYQLSVIRAVLSEFRGEHSMAVQLARKALEASEMKTSGFRSHQNLGIVIKINPQIRERLQLILARD